MPNKNVTLRLGNYIRLTVVHVSQGDTSLTWVFQIVDESGNVYAPAVRYAILAGNKPDGHAFAYLCTKVGDTYQLPPSAYDVQMTAAAGLVTAELRLIDNNGRSIGTCNFTIDVEEGPEGAVTVANDSSLPAYMTILQELGVLIGKVETLPDDVPGYISDWLEDHISGGQGVAVDNTLTVQGAAADAKATGDRIKALEDATIQTDTSLTVAGAAADAESVGLILGTADYDLSDPAQWEQGAYNRGVPSESTIRIRMKGYLPASVNRVSVSSPYSALLYAYGKDGSYIGYWDDGEGGYTQSANGTFKNELEIPDDGYLHTLILKNGSNQTIDTSAASAVAAETGGGLMQRVAELEGREAGLPSSFKAAMYDLLSHMTGTFSDGRGAAYLDAVIRSMGFDPGGLPGGYQQVSYIEGTGAQYIVANFTPKTLPIRVEMGVYKASMPNAEQALLGLKKNLVTSSPLEIGYTSNILFAFSGASAKLSDTSAIVGKKIDIVATFKNTSPYKTLEVTAAGQTYKAESSEANNSLLGTALDNMGIFCVDGGNIASARLYYLRIYEGDDLFADFVPCYNVSTGIVGLYEMVRGSFHYSKTTPFLKGADVNG